MDRILRSRATHLRPPAVAASATGAVEFTRDECTVIGEEIPFARVPGSRLIGFDEAGSTVREDDKGFVRPDRDVQVRDLFVEGGNVYRVEAVYLTSAHLKSFALRRVVMR
jgi:hypothetical protein